jgi:hypothetical protein
LSYSNFQLPATQIFKASPTISPLHLPQLLNSKLEEAAVCPAAHVSKDVVTKEIVNKDVVTKDMVTKDIATKGRPSLEQMKTTYGKHKLLFQAWRNNFAVATEEDVVPELRELKEALDDLESADLSVPEGRSFVLVWEPWYMLQVETFLRAYGRTEAKKELAGMVEQIVQILQEAFSVAHENDEI